MTGIKLEVDAVTPIFIAGADQRNIENEGLRAPSLRGLLRWWFRAVSGGVKLSSGVLSIEDVKNEENAIWGTTERRSKVTLHASPVSLNIGPASLNGRGERYLGYGLFGRKCILPGSIFEITIHFSSEITEHEENKAIATMWLMLTLGSIGSKGRKGFGSLRISKDITINGMEFRSPKDVKDLEEYICENVRNALKIFGWKGFAANISLLSPFPVLMPNLWKMKILDEVYSSPTDAIDNMGRKIRAYREDQNPSALHTRYIRGKPIRYRVTRDYDAIKSVYTYTHAATPLGSIFGLPHQFQFQSIKKKAVVKGIKHERRASPLHIKIWKLNNGEYAVGLQLFKSIFLPENALRISDMDDPDNIRREANLPSFSYLENFLNTLPGKWINL